jgi:hypothetical protein
MDLHDPRGQLHLDYLEAPLRYEEQRAAHLVARSDVIGSSVTHICYRYLEEAILDRVLINTQIAALAFCWTSHIVCPKNDFRTIVEGLAQLL